MNTIGVLLLAAAAAGDGFGYDKPNVGGKKLLAAWRGEPRRASAGGHVAVGRGRHRRGRRDGRPAVPERPQPESTSSIRTGCRSAGKPARATASVSICPRN